MGESRLVGPSSPHTCRGGFINKRAQCLDGQCPKGSDGLVRRNRREIGEIKMNAIRQANLTSLLPSPIIILLRNWGRQASTGAVTSVAMHAGPSLRGPLSNRREQ